MNSKRINWVAIGVTALVLLNIALMATIWLQQRSDKPGNAGPRPGDRNPLASELRFDSAQRKAFDTLRAKHFALNQQYRENMRALKDQYFDGIKTGAAPDQQIAAQIAALQTTIDSTTYRHFAEVRALCSDDQKEDFDRLLRRIINAVGRPGQRPHDRQGPPPPGPDERRGEHPDGQPEDEPPH
ncbi:MAG: hypothetical protein EOO15_09650 [Chitinophagaceae bacterium]|nr:MAG: hypothetical protein EOO15_09650 [Chitinophagaceae bacterium]